MGAALLMRDPPAGWQPAGWKPLPGNAASGADSFTLRMALSTWQWYALWAVLFFNVSAGISIISQASPMAQEITGVNAAMAASMVGIISVANGAGRFLWAWLSDVIGRRWVFLAMFVLQAGLFSLLPRVHSFGLFAAFALVILLCYGGGFGTMPAFCADYFGTRDAGSIYGLMLTAWGCGSVFGPVLIAHVRQSTGRYEQALLILTASMIGAAVIPLFLRAPARTETAKPVVPELLVCTGSEPVSLAHNL